MENEASAYVRILPEWIEWADVASCFFCLTRRDLLHVPLKELEEHHRKEHLDFLCWGYELDVLEFDLKQCVNEFVFQSRSMYQEEDQIDILKFIVLYHIDNFNVRVSKLVDNARKLVKRADESRNLSPCDLASARKALREFENREVIDSAVNARHQFVHRYREQPENRDFLSPRVRLNEIYGAFDADDPLAKAVRCLDRANLDGFVNKKARDLKAILEEIEGFRDSLFRSVATTILEFERASDSVPADGTLAEFLRMKLDPS